MNDQEIIAKVTTAVALHRATKADLIKRMEALLDPVPGGVVLTVAGHRISYATVYGQCSQWGDNSYAVTGDCGAFLIDGETTLGSPNPSFFDGRNHQGHFGGVYSDEGCSDRVRPASVKVLREIAKELPAALVAYAERLTAGAGQTAAITDTL